MDGCNGRFKDYSGWMKCQKKFNGPFLSQMGEMDGCNGCFEAYYGWMDGCNGRFKDCGWPF